MRVCSFICGLVLLTLPAACLSACGGKASQAARVPQAGIFAEAGDAEAPPKGMVDLTVTASVKTPTREHYLLESRRVPPGGFPFELSVDGQKIVWKVEGVRESTPVYGTAGRLPEGGEGIRYVLKKTIRLPAGPHHIAFSIPYDNYYAEVDISLIEDEDHVIQFQPVYAMGRRAHRSFFHGISRTVVYFDGVRIK